MSKIEESQKKIERMEEDHLSYSLILSLIQRGFDITNQTQPLSLEGSS